MPPKKKAKKTQTVSLDKRAQSKMLGDKASALEAEDIVGDCEPRSIAHSIETFFF